MKASEQTKTLEKEIMFKNRCVVKRCWSVGFLSLILQITRLSYSVVRSASVNMAFLLMYALYTRWYWLVIRCSWVQFCAVQSPEITVFSCHTSRESWSGICTNETEQSLQTMAHMIPCWYVCLILLLSFCALIIIICIVQVCQQQYFHTNWAS